MNQACVNAHPAQTLDSTVASVLPESSSHFVFKKCHNLLQISDLQKRDITLAIVAGDLKFNSGTVCA